MLGRRRAIVPRSDPAHLGEAALSLFEQRIAEHGEVIGRCRMTGERDCLIRIAMTGIGALETFILEPLTPSQGIEKIRSSLALKQLPVKTALPRGP